MLKPFVANILRCHGYRLAGCNHILSASEIVLDQDDTNAFVESVFHMQSSTEISIQL